MASEEPPLFDTSLKKKKKKVLFQEDPLGAEADPTTPAPTSIDNTTTTGEAVDLGPSTAHEQMQRESRGEDDDEAKKDDDDMFADMKKKKKKKKEIPMDFVSACFRRDRCQGTLNINLIHATTANRRCVGYIHADDRCTGCIRRPRFLRHEEEEEIKVEEA